MIHVAGITKFSCSRWHPQAEQIRLHVAGTRSAGALGKGQQAMLSQASSIGVRHELNDFVENSNSWAFSISRVVSLFVVKESWKALVDQHRCIDACFVWIDMDVQNRGRPRWIAMCEFDVLRYDLGTGIPLARVWLFQALSAKELVNPVEKSYLFAAGSRERMVEVPRENAVAAVAAAAEATAARRGMVAARCMHISPSGYGNGTPGDFGGGRGGAGGRGGGACGLGGGSAGPGEGSEERARPASRWAPAKGGSRNRPKRQKRVFMRRVCAGGGAARGCGEGRGGFGRSWGVDRGRGGLGGARWKHGRGRGAKTGIGPWATRI
ncbi:hypothetical protein T492DRAFT_834091 [Pavlovales sp. CCMP2436]|nr:hypothetical protein T492DRAFT_834091 [Pavlovales sp. CCMP2436]